MVDAAADPSCLRDLLVPSLDAIPVTLETITTPEELVTMFPAAQNGKWVATKDKKSADLFMAEKKREDQARVERAERSRQFWSDQWRRVRRLFSRSSS